MSIPLFLLCAQIVDGSFDPSTVRVFIGGVLFTTPNTVANGPAPLTVKVARLPAVKGGAVFCLSIGESAKARSWGK